MAIIIQAKYAIPAKINVNIENRYLPSIMRSSKNLALMQNIIAKQPLIMCKPNSFIVYFKLAILIPYIEFYRYIL